MRAGESSKSCLAPRTFHWDDIAGYTRLVNGVRGLVGKPRAFSASYMAECLGQPGCIPEEDCFLEERDGSPVGYSLVVPELAIGRVVVEGGVLAEYRRGGLGGRLLDAALERAWSLGAEVVHIAAPGDNLQSRLFLEHRGFSPVRRYWEMRWQEEDVPELEVPAGFSLRSYLPGDAKLLTRVQNDAFMGSWGFCSNTVEQVSYRAGLSGCRPEGILFLIWDGEVAAYCWTRIEGKGWERVGVVCMTGVTAPYRGLGLGRAALLAGMGHLRSQGVNSIELTVDSENLPATSIYVPLGFRRVAETLWYERKLAP